MSEGVAELVTALSANDPSRIRHSATAVVNVVTASIEERKKRHRAQLETLADELRSLKGELMNARERATLDALTKLYNRASFDEHIARIADLGLLLGAPPSLLMIDVDHFKSINDVHGHPGGDDVLRKIGRAHV